MELKQALAFTAALGLFGGTNMAQEGLILESWRANEFRQFDFWLGKWDVNLRMIQPDNSWKDSVQAKVEVYSILDGKAILELWDSPSIKGFSLRYFDPAKKKWVLYLNWPSNGRSSVSSLEGKFRHGRGVFYSGPPLGPRTAGAAGKTSRYTFCDITPDSLRWDDAYTSDGGKTWTNNWIMEFSRTAPSAAWPAGALAHTFQDGGRCQGESFDALNSMAGEWEGHAVVQGEGQELAMKADMRVFNALDGCSVLRFINLELDGKAYRSFGLLTYNASDGSYEELSLDNTPGGTARLYRGKLNGELLALRASGKQDGEAALFRHHWALPGAEDQLVLESASSMDSELWSQSVSIRFSRKGQALDFGQVINNTCPRSGKAVVPSSLAEYRGRVVGFCNTHCRDDFVANLGGKTTDEPFFDQIIDSQ